VPARSAPSLAARTQPRLAPRGIEGMVAMEMRMRRAVPL